LNKNYDRLNNHH